MLVLDTSISPTYGLGIESTNLTVVHGVVFAKMV
jgi:hypothetical protein